MKSALIGHTGFVGSNIARQMRFDEFYNSKNIEDIRGQAFDLVVCAGMPGTKWVANENPLDDFDSIVGLLGAIRDAEIGEIVLISTIDAIKPKDPYGCHRADAEAILRSYRNTIVIRLPALFGEGLRKNALYDLMTGEMLECIAPNATYQWHPLRRLGADIAHIRRAGKKTINIASEPIIMEAIRARFFPDRQIGSYDEDAATYCVEGDQDYSLTRTEVFDEMGAFLAGDA